ncbi:MAG: tetratricopeptide repeat protein, partial [Planctomycetota bacterium]
MPSSFFRKERLGNVCALAGIAIAGLIVYANSFSGVFLFDDWFHIEQGVRIRRLWPPWGWLSSQRPVVTLSLAVNYMVGGLRPGGYHAVNVAVHLLAGCVLYGVILRTLRRPVLRETFGSAARMPAFASALIWTVHPLQTESVTYIVQRSESMMGLAYLLTLYSAIRAFEARRPWGWFLVAIVCCILGMATKAVMITAPLIVLTYDVMFVSGSVREALGRRWAFYLALAATVGVLWMTGTAPHVLGLSGRRAHVGLAVSDVTPLAYALTQGGVWVHYLRLALWPDDLCLDYGWPLASRVSDVVWPSLIVVPLVVGTVIACWKRKPIGFLGWWFVVILAPTSSVIPLKDPAFEHRMYLPLAAVVAAVVLGAYRVGQRRDSFLSFPRWPAAWASLVAVAVALGWRTADRNRDYESAVTMWADTVRKRPENLRARLALGTALVEAGRPAEAVSVFRRVLDRDPGNEQAYCGLGSALGRLGRLDEALQAEEAAIRLNPRLAAAHYNRGNLLLARGDPAGAMEAFEQAVKLAPGFIEARCNLALRLQERGRLDEAERHYRAALQRDPDHDKTNYNFGNLLLSRDRLEEAAACYRRALRRNPR